MTPDIRHGLVRKPPIDLAHGLVTKPAPKAEKKAEAKPAKPTHHFGEVTGFEETSGLPIVRRTSHSSTSNEVAKPEVSPIGSEDPESGRETLHAKDNPEAIAAKAKAEHPAVKATLKEAIAGVKGAKLHGDRDEKPEARVEEKIEDEGQPAKTIPDYSGFRVAVDSHEAHHQAVSAIKGKLKVVREKDEFEKGAPDTAFHAHMLQVQHPGSDVSHEVQVLPKQVADGAEANHALYERARTGDKDAAAGMKTKNEAAWNEFQGTQSSKEGGRGESPERTVGGGDVDAPPSAALKKGSPVRLKDGSHGTVDFVPAWGKLGKVRVKTADGRTVHDVPQQDLTPTDGGYIAVDLDSTLAHYTKFEGPTVIGAPIPAMVERVKQWLAEGKDVRIFTARVAEDKTGEARKAIEAWLKKNIGQTLPITNVKDHHMKTLYDDRAVQVGRNTGELLGEPEAAMEAQ
jgi:hypothetical protein